MVLAAYRKLFVVKAVETFVDGKLPELELQDTDDSTYTYNFVDWNTLCNTPHIVDIMWHARILHTRTYASDCATVTGSIIHHTPGYFMPRRRSTRTLNRSAVRYSISRSPNPSSLMVTERPTSYVGLRLPRRSLLLPVSPFWSFLLRTRVVFNRRGRKGLRFI